MLDEDAACALAVLFLISSLFFSSKPASTCTSASTPGEDPSSGIWISTPLLAATFAGLIWATRALAHSGARADPRSASALGDSRIASAVLLEEPSPCRSAVEPTDVRSDISSWSLVDACEASDGLLGDWSAPPLAAPPAPTAVGAEVVMVGLIVLSTFAVQIGSPADVACSVAVLDEDAACALAVTGAAASRWVPAIAALFEGRQRTCACDS